MEDRADTYPRRAVTSRDWRDALALGGALGAIVLGIGGRVAMRIVANANWQEPVLTASGTLTVVRAAALSAGESIGAAAEQALKADDRFDPATALAGLFADELVVEVTL